MGTGSEPLAAALGESGCREVPVPILSRELVLYEEHRRGCFRVVACSGKFGITPGMPLVEAAALGPVQCELHDPLADEAVLKKLAGWCEQFSPIVGIEGTDDLCLDVTGLGPLFGGEEAIVQQIARAFGRLGLQARLALADTLGAAWAMAAFWGGGGRRRAAGEIG